MGLGPASDTRCDSFPSEMTTQSSDHQLRWRYSHAHDPYDPRAVACGPDRTLWLWQVDVRSPSVQRDGSAVSGGFQGPRVGRQERAGATDDAFAALHFVAARRLARGKLT